MELGWSVLSHTSHSPHLASNNCYLFFTSQNISLMSKCLYTNTRFKSTSKKLSYQNLTQNSYNECDHSLFDWHSLFLLFSVIHKLQFLPQFIFIICYHIYSKTIVKGLKNIVSINGRMSKIAQCTCLEKKCMQGK